MARSTRQTLFEEYLRAPKWMFVLLGIMLGLSSGGLTAVGIRSFTDDPLLTGSEAAIFFISFAIGTALILYAMLNATLLSIRADANGIEVKLGILGVGDSWSWDSIASATPASHNIMRHGGRGNIFAPSSRRSWTMIGITNGVEITVHDDKGGARICFVSSRRGEDLAKLIEVARADTERDQTTDRL